MQDFDFNYLAIEGTSQPMIAVSRILRDLVERLLEQLFSRKSPSDKRPPTLTSLLLPQEARALMELHFWKLKGLHPTVPKNRKSRLKTTLKDLVTRTIHSNVEPREWQLTFHDRLVRMVGGGTPGKGLPLVLDPVLEKAAWCDLRFQRSTAIMVNDYLRERVLFIPGERVVPGFSPGAFWALIGLAGAEKSAEEKMFSRMVEEIRAEARARALVKGWAGFWDQWLIRVARRNWARAFEREKSRFCRSLLALPLISRPSPLSPQQQVPYTPKRSFSTRDRIKKWLLSFFEKRRVPPRLKGKKTDSVNLAHPDWEDQVPEILRDKR
jgi:hypothetical protein